MGVELTVTLPEHVYQRARRLAELTGRDVVDILVDRLDSLLPPLSSELDVRPVETLSDEDVLVLADSQMEADQGSRLSVLLQKQQADTINDGERAELSMLMEIYDAGQLRKSQALVEAVKRGLREPLSL
jgi:NADH dehydrogenase FAD-containing subunit